MPKFLVTLSKKNISVIKRWLIDVAEYDKYQVDTPEKILKEIFYIEGSWREDGFDLRDNVKIKEVTNETLPWDLCQTPDANSKARDKAKRSN